MLSYKLLNTSVRVLRRTHHVAVGQAVAAELERLGAKILAKPTKKKKSAAAAKNSKATEPLFKVCTTGVVDDTTCKFTVLMAPPNQERERACSAL